MLFLFKTSPAFVSHNMLSICRLLFLDLADELEVVAARVRVPSLAHSRAAPGEGHSPRQAVLLRGGERPVEPAELRDQSTSSAGPHPLALRLDVVARRPELISESYYILDTLDKLWLYVAHTSTHVKRKV